MSFPVFRKPDPFKIKYVCLKCGYIREREERKCPRCGDPIGKKIVKTIEH